MAIQNALWPESVWPYPLFGSGVWPSETAPTTPLNSVLWHGNIWPNEVWGPVWPKTHLRYNDLLIIYDYTADEVPAVDDGLTLEPAELCRPRASYPAVVKEPALARARVSFPQPARHNLPGRRYDHYLDVDP